MNKLVNDDLAVECLIQSLSNYLEAKLEHDSARDKYEGHSWDYHGHRYVEAKETAAHDFGKRLAEYVDHRIAASKNS